MRPLLEIRDGMLLVRQATKEGYLTCPVGGICDISYPSSLLRRGRVQDGGVTSPTVTAETNGLVVFIKFEK